MGMTRTEHDLLGTREVPSEAYYGIHTLRAVENFPITGRRISAYPELINALAAIKQAAALSNRDLGLLDASKARAIMLPARMCAAGNCTTNSLSMSSRVALAPRPT
ncbi:lyase family protein [Asaia platycodi]|nr:lyase family protein [Asaia platycodi]